MISKVKSKIQAFGFWERTGKAAAVIAIVVSLLGIYTAWKEQVIAMQTQQIIDVINQIETFKQQENKAITVARMTLLNQQLECPITDKEQLIKMHQQRNNTLVEIAINDSGLQLQNAKKIRSILQNITQIIFSINTGAICKLQVDTFDEKLRQLQTSYNMVVNQAITSKEHQLKNMQTKFV